MFRNLFNPDSALMITMSQVTDCIFLSLFFLVGCVPVFTVGASMAALYDASFQACRRGDKHSWSRVWEVYRRNWRAGIVPTAVFLLIFGLLIRGLILLWNAAVAGTLSWMLFSAAALAGALVLGGLCVLFPMLSRFENTTGALLKNTALLSLSQAPRTVLLGIVNFGCVYCCARFIIPLFLLPALTALAGTVLIEPMFRPYMKMDNEQHNT